MGQRVSMVDFEWTYTDEPHRSRREEILRKYPEIKKLYGHDPNFKWHIVFMVLFQLASIPFVSTLSWSTIFILAYVVGGTINHILAQAQHEITHNFVFGHGRPRANRLFGIFANLPLMIPFSLAFKKYHIEHHRFLSVDAMDPDLPTLIEAKLFRTSWGKLLWVVLQPFFYTIRPYMVRTLPVGKMELTNIALQLLFDICVIHCYGWKPFMYLFVGLVMASGLHPVAGHHIAEHYMFKKGFETYSYYGSWNLVIWNVGYHNEHHDFPAVPGCNLPKVRQIAREFYDPLPHHDSWIKVMYDFIFDPAVGPYARIKREHTVAAVSPKYKIYNGTRTKMHEKKLSKEEDRKSI